MRGFALCLVLALWPSPSISEVLAGRASVIDGDTIEIHGERIRLGGIDAPESQQECEHADRTPYHCGTDAAFALADFIGQSTVFCERRGVDRYKRTIAACQVRREDVGTWMVRSGQALAFRRYSMDSCLTKPLPLKPMPASGGAGSLRRGIGVGEFGRVSVGHA